MTPFCPRCHRILAFLLVLLGCFAGSQAGANVYLYQSYSEREGLLNNQVNGMTQDPEGFIWFSTRTGITRYDGQQWVNYDHTSGIQEREFSHIQRGPFGRIWAVSKRVPFRVQYFEDGVWKALEAPPIPRINGLTFLFEVGLSAEGQLLICVLAQGSPICFYTEGRWRFIVDDRLSSPAYSYLLEDGQLIVSNSRGVFTVNPLLQTVLDNPWPDVPPEPLLVMEKDSTQQSIWLVGEDWIGQRDESGFHLLEEGLDLTADQAWDRTGSLVDREGGLYFGGLNQAYRYDIRLGLEELDRETGRQTSGATSFYQDREGNLWITSLRGVDKLISRRFVGLDRSQGLFLDEVSAVLQDRNDQIILGHEKGLTFLGDEIRFLAFDFGRRKLGRVMGMAEDSRGNLWVGTDGSGLLRLSPDREMRWYDEDDGLPLRVFSLHVDGRDRIWAGTFAGLFSGGDQGFRPIDLPNKDREDPLFVRRITEASDGSLYLTTGRDGVIRYRPDEIKQWRGADVNTGNSTFAVLETPSGRIWVGSSVGLFTLEGDTLVETSAPDPVIRRPIFAMTRDSSGQTWFGTDAGVYIWDGDHLVHYSVDQGLIGSEINRAALMEDNQGQIWVGTDRGVSIYRPWLDLPRREPPLLRITDFEIDGRRYPGGRPIVLGAPPKTFQANFRGLSFTDEDHMRFRTWLSPFEQHWSEWSAGPINEFRYTNLLPGEYRFRVQLLNTDGSISEVVSSETITVKPPLFSRWWVLLGLLLLTVVVAYFIIASWTARRYQARLEKEVEERTNELAESERTVRLESQRLLATLGSILDGVLALDDQDRVVLCNPAAERILDRPGSAILGRDFAEVMPLNKGPVQALAEGHLEFNCTERLEFPRRGTVCLDISTAAITDGEGRRTGAVVAFSDITDKLRMERELIRSQKLESLGLLAGGIAHDFNNLLTIMLGNMDLVEHAPGLEPLDMESLQLAKQASIRARSLTEQLLTFARGGAPIRQLHELQEIIEQSVALSFSGMAANCEVDLPADLWPVDVDAGQMGQVFNNLLINAAQAMPEGGLARVRGANIPAGAEKGADGDWVRVEVQDEGPGIPEANLARIFDPYFTTKPRGSGLGLATAHSIVTRHGGRIQVDSAAGRGSVFQVSLPRGRGQALTDAAPEEAALPHSGRVLVLEDEAGIQALFRRYLDTLGLDVVITADGVETVQVFREALESGMPFDLVLADLTIPGGMGGRRTMAELRKLQPAVKGVVISGYSHEDVLANYREHGFRGALAKPFNLDQLRNTLARVMAGD